MNIIKERISTLEKMGYQVLEYPQAIDVRLITNKRYGCSVEVSHSDLINNTYVITAIVYRLNYLIKQDL